MKYYDEDGQEVEMPSQEEIADLKAKAEKAGDSEKLSEMEKSIREALGIKPEDDLVEAVKLAKESANPNWPATRTKLNKMTEFIKSINPKAKIGEDGTIDVEEKLDSKSIEEKARNAARQEIFGQEINRGFDNLKHLTKEEKVVVKKAFEKLSSGEELNSETIPVYMQQAVNATFPKKSSVDIEGGSPRIGGSGENFAETTEGKEAANSFFGEDSFAKKEK